MRTSLLRRTAAAAAFAFAMSLAAQELPAPDAWLDVSDTAVTVRCLLQAPHTAAGDAKATWLPVLLLLPQDAADGAAAQALMRSVGADAARAGFVVLAPLCGGGTVQLSVPGSQQTEWRAGSTALARVLPQLLADVRKEYRVAQGALHVAAVAADIDAAIALVRQHRHEFQTFTALGEAPDASLAALRRLPARRVHVLTATDAAARQRFFAALLAERTQPGAAGDIAQVLDDFHDAAAKADGARYFAILPEDAVFLGTDPGERWTGAEFRAFAQPYFRRKTAWTYYALDRHVTIAPGGDCAWFDEVLANASYGECRGTGVLSRRGDRWVILQYDLTIPVPNDLANDVVAKIRAFHDGATRR